MRKVRFVIFGLLLISSGFSMLSAYADNSDSNFSAQQQFGMSFDQIRTSAAQGDPDAEYALGYMYYYGKGTPRDEQAAKMWIQKAAAQGQPQAVKAAQMLGVNSQPTVSDTQAKGDLLQQNKLAAGNADATLKANQATVSTNSANPNTATAANSSSTADNSTNNNGASATADSSSPDVAASSSNPDVAGVAPNASAAGSAIAAATPDNAAQTVATDTAAAPVTKKITANGKVKANKISARENNTSSNNPKTALSEQKLLHAPAHYYTIQLLASHDQSDITGFMKKHNLQKQTTYYKTSFHNKPWYVLVYGLYPSDSHAQAALKQLPVAVQKLNPWVKSLASVKQAINTSSEVASNN